MSVAYFAVRRILKGQFRQLVHFILCRKGFPAVGLEDDLGCEDKVGVDGR